MFQIGIISSDYSISDEHKAFLDELELFLEGFEYNLVRMRKNINLSEIDFFLFFSNSMDLKRLDDLVNLKDRYDSINEYKNLEFQGRIHLILNTVGDDRNIKQFLEISPNRLLELGDSTIWQKIYYLKYGFNIDLYKKQIKEISDLIKFT